MAKRRIPITIDADVEAILQRNKREDESESACLARIVKQAGAVATQLEIMNLRAEKTHDETRRLMTQFLSDVQQPFDQINRHLGEISGMIRNKK